MNHRTTIGCFRYGISHSTVASPAPIEPAKRVSRTTGFFSSSFHVKRSKACVGTIDHNPRETERMKCARAEPLSSPFCLVSHCGSLPYEDISGRVSLFNYLLSHRHEGGSVIFRDGRNVSMPFIYRSTTTFTLSKRPTMNRDPHFGRFVAVDRQ